MNEGITVNGQDSWLRHGLRILKRSIGSAPKDDHTERVPFSNVTYDFGAVYGQSRGERTLKYRLEFLCFDKKKAQEKIVNILEWLHWSGRQDLYDALLPDYHYEVSEPAVSWGEEHGAYTFDLTFRANPEIVPNDGCLVRNVTLPDVNGDGFVDSVDSAMILSAYTKASTGEDSGLTEEQKKAADANTDGYIDSVDAALVMDFYGKLSVGEYSCTAEGWAKYLNDIYRKRNVVI